MRYSRSLWMPGVAAFVLSAPLAFLVGRTPPGWLSEAWQVTGVLLGIGIALIVFLLEAATRRVRSQTSFTALVRYVELLWPLAFGLIFIGWIAAIERTAQSHRDPSAWVETYALALFLLQLALTARVFVRSIRAVSTDGLQEVLVTAFEAERRQSLDVALERRAGARVLGAACDAERVKHGPFLASGKPLTAARAGVLRDLDLALPRRASELGIAGQTTITAELKRTVGAGSPIAKVEGVHGPLMPMYVRRGAHVRRRTPQEADPGAVFSEALEIGRQAIADRSFAGLEFASGVIVGCARVLPQVWRDFGVEYVAAHVEEFPRLSVDDEVFRELFRFSRTAFTSGDQVVHGAVVELGLRLAFAAAEEEAPFLLDQSLRLLLMQGTMAPQLPDDQAGQLRKAVSDAMESVATRLRFTVEDAHTGVDERERALDYLVLAFEWEVRLLNLWLEQRAIAAYHALRNKQRRRRERGYDADADEDLAA